MSRGDRASCAGRLVAELPDPEAGSSPALGIPPNPRKGGVWERDALFRETVDYLSQPGKASFLCSGLAVIDCVLRL